jgi:hypothetical protein
MWSKIPCCRVRDEDFCKILFYGNLWRGESNCGGHNVSLLGAHLFSGSNLIQLAHGGMYSTPTQAILL